MRFFVISFRPADMAIWMASLLLVGFYVLGAGEGFPLDDSWIHQSYARNLADHGEWAWVAGEPSAASTSPLYTVLLAVGYLLDIPPMIWTHLLGAASLALLTMLLVRMAAWHLPGAAWVVGLLALSTWHLVWSAAAGMETLLFSLLTMALIYLAWHGHFVSGSIPPMPSAAIFGIVAALTTLARWEGILLAGMVLLVMPWIQPESRRRWVVYYLMFMLAFAVIISPYLLLNLQLTGGLLPNSAQAKFQQYAPLLELPFWLRVQNLVAPLLAGGQVLLVPGLLIYGWMQFRFGLTRAAIVMSLPLWWLAALIVLYAAKLPAAYQHGRYVIPALPPLVLVGSIGLMAACRQWQRNMPTRVTLRVWLVACLTVSLIFVLFIAPPVYQRDVAIINQEMVAAARWIAENIPETELLASHDIGAVGFFARRPVLDIAGLLNPEVLSIMGNAEALWAWMQARNARYLMAFPYQIPGNSVDDERLCRVFITHGTASRQAGGTNMAIYRLAWDGVCHSDS